MRGFLFGILGALGFMAALFAVYYFAILFVCGIVYFGGHIPL